MRFERLSGFGPQALAWIAAALITSSCTRSEEPETAPPVAQAPEVPAASAAPVPAAPPPPPPELYVEPEANPEEGAPPLAVRFSVLVEDNVGAVECEWDFGDGSPKVKSLEPTHVFQTENDYEVVAVCRDEKGVTGEGDIDVFVEAAS
jgi:PKD repeat protein